MSEVREILEHLGLSVYAERLIAEGFDTWQTLCDVTESDLNDLQVKLGHRRKLQRAIADKQQHYDAPHFSIAQTVSLNEGRRRSDETTDGANLQQKKSNEDTQDSSVRTKRKYRRHPKADAHAPERPPSAYVLFSNHMREMLRSKELSFTDMAKVVGERWQELPADEREKFEKQASSAKERYLEELAAYKKTDYYAQYMQYLADFKARNNTDHEVKRGKLQRFTSSANSSHESPEAAPGTRRHRSSGSPSSNSRDGGSPVEDSQTTVDGYHDHHSQHSVERSDRDYRSPTTRSPVSARLPSISATTTFGRDKSVASVSSGVPIDGPRYDSKLAKPYFDSRTPTPASAYADHKDGVHIQLGPDGLPTNSILHNPPLLPPLAANSSLGSLRALMDDSPRSRRILPAPIPHLHHQSPIGLPDEHFPFIKSEILPKLNQLTTTKSLPERGIPPPIRDDGRAGASLAVLLRAGEQLAAQDEINRGASSAPLPVLGLP